jgi:hypothetical protein
MKTNPLNPGALAEGAVGSRAVSRKMIRERATEIGLTNGHPTIEITKTEWEQAKRELADESAARPRPALLDSAPEGAGGQSKDERAP